MARVRKEGGAEGEGSVAVIRTFGMEEAPPAWRSYAGEIAAQYGISYEQLRDVHRERALLDAK